MLVEREEPTGYGMAKNLGPSSVEPGTANTSPLADELKRVNAMGDGGDHLQDIIEHGTARDTMVDLASLQTRPYDDVQDVPTSHGMRNRSNEGGKVPNKLGEVGQRRTRTTRMRKQWSPMASVTIPTPQTGDEKIWRLYSLCLVCNRHVADFMDDDDVSEALNKMRARLPLPYGFDFDRWSPR